MRTQKHVHKLQRHKYKNKTVVYFCTLPDCSFKSEPALIVGKRSICNKCDREFLLDNYSLGLKLPHCNRCIGKSSINSIDGSRSDFSLDNKDTSRIQELLDDGNDRRDSDDRRNHPRRIEELPAEVKIARANETVHSLREKMNVISRVQYETIEIHDSDPDEEFL